MAKDFFSDVDFKNGTVTLTSTDAGSSAAPILELYRNSASPADADYIGQIKFQGRHDGGAKALYAKITGKIGDASDGSEDGIIEIAHQKAGSNNISARFTSDALKLINGTGLEIADGLLTLGSTAVTSTAAELNILDGVTSTTAELNILDGVTSTAAELNILDGVTSTAAELNILDGVTSTAAELNLVDGITAGTVSASLAVIADSNKDVTGFRNVTLTGILDAVNFKVNGGQGSDGQVLTSTGSGVAWESAAGGSPGGSNTQIQFNNSSSFGGNANLVYDGSSLVTMTKSGANTGIKLDVASDTEAHSGNIAFYKSEAAGAGRLDKDAVYGQIDFYGQTASNGYHHAAAIKTLVGDYFYSDNYTPSDIEFWATPADQTSPIRRLVVRGGTSNTDAAAMEVWHNGGANKGGRVDFVDDDGTQLGYFGYSNNSTFYIKNNMTYANNGNIFLEAEGDIYVRARGEYEVQFNQNGLEPYADEGYKLGASNREWSEAYIVDLKISGNSTMGGTLTVGVDDTGHDVKFFGATSGKYMEWDESADQLDVTGSLDVTGNSTMTGTLTVGVDDTGHDVIFYGATATNGWAWWDESADAFIVGPAGHLAFGESSPTWPVEFATDDDLTSFTGTGKGGVCITNSQYDADDFTALDFGYTGSDNPIGRIATKVTGGGSEIHFGTSNSYGSGITNTAMVIRNDGRVQQGTGISTSFTRAAMAIGSNDDITPDSAWDGHFTIDGNGYGGGISLDGSMMWVGHNSTARGLALSTNETNRFYVTGSLGYVYVNSTGGADFPSTDGKFSVAGGDNVTAAFYRATNISTRDVVYVYSDYSATGTKHFQIEADGDVDNTNNSYGSLSDQRLKENIVDARDYYEDLRKLEVKNFNFCKAVKVDYDEDVNGEIDLSTKTVSLVDTDADSRKKLLGLVAQPTEQVMAGLVKTDDDGYKHLRYSVLVPMLLQMCQKLADKVEALESA